jgi:hypothetical protein
VTYQVPARQNAELTEVNHPSRTAKNIGRHIINKPFYVYEHEVWLKPYQTPEGRKQWEEMDAKMQDNVKEAYLDTFRIPADGALDKIFGEYFDIKHDLMFLNPELAEKYFSFTLDAKANIKVTDPDNVLTPSEQDYLQEIFSNRNGMKENMHVHARAAMALVDHNSKTFGGQYMLRIENYEHTIDYIELLTRNTRGKYLWGFEDQVIRRCSPRTGPLFETTA